MSQTQSKRNVHNKRGLASVWLIATLIVTLLTFTLWIFSASASAIESEEDETQAEQTEVESSLLNEISLTRQITNLDELQSSVAPISFDDIIMDMRNYPAEFKDKKYLITRQGKWTIQVMNVSDHNIIKDYLETREDRSDFAYFRYIDDFKQTRYLLVYGVMGTEEKINNLFDKVDFSLPKGVTAKPIKFSNYLSKVDNYERADSIVAITSKQPREVNLKPTNRELAARTATLKMKDPTDVVNTVTAPDSPSNLKNNDLAASDASDELEKAQNNSAANEGSQTVDGSNNAQNVQPQKEKSNLNDSVRPADIQTKTDAQKPTNEPNKKTPVKNNESKPVAKKEETKKSAPAIANSSNNSSTNVGSQPKQFNPDDVE